VVALPLAYKTVRQSGSVLGWLLVGIAITPPLVFMLHPTVNGLSDILLHQGIKIETPRLGPIPPLTLYERKPLLPRQEHTPFEPLRLYTYHLYDGSPAYSYDFTLTDGKTDSDWVNVPSPCPGVILSTGYDAGGYGNQLELKCDDGPQWLMAHFAELHVSANQTVKKGDPLGIQGSTGNSTGPHVHAEIDVTGDGLTDSYEQTEPIIKAAFELWQSGLSAPQPEMFTLSDTDLKKIIGSAEGTVDPKTLLPDADYQGHDDPCVLNGTCPGRGKNKGYFSADFGATPEEANEIQLQRLQQAERKIQAQAIQKFGQPLSTDALAEALDLWNQAPLAAEDPLGGFVDRLPRAHPSDQEILDARTQSFIDPRDGVLKAPGLGNTLPGVRHDQSRRSQAVQSTLDRLRQENRKR